MPKYESVDGKWIPVDEAAKKVCEDRGIEYLGVGISDSKQGGVLPVPSFPKVATGKMDGTNIATPTPAQKIKLDKKNK
jgi:hypothetical protein